MFIKLCHLNSSIPLPSLGKSVPLVIQVCNEIISTGASLSGAFVRRSQKTWEDCWVGARSLCLSWDSAVWMCDYHSESALQKHAEHVNSPCTWALTPSQDPLLVLLRVWSKPLFELFQTFTFLPHSFAAVSTWPVQALHLKLLHMP